MSATATILDDQELARRTVHFLNTRDLRGLENVQVAADGGVLVVDGQLPSLDAKRRCLECCRHVAGVVQVVDRLSVLSTTVETDHASDAAVAEYDSRSYGGAWSFTIDSPSALAGVKENRRKAR